LQHQVGRVSAEPEVAAGNRRAEPEPERVIGPLYAGDASRHTSGANAIDAHANQQQADRGNKYSDF